MKPTWTILIATLGQRRNELARLLAGLMPQVDAAGGQVNVLAYWDNGETAVAAKRQALLDAADGDYLCFVDDDDTVSPDYVSSILEALESRPDYVGFKMQCYNDRLPTLVSHHSLANGGWKNEPEIYLRDITTSNPMRSDFAKRATFGVMRGQPEDIDWVIQIRRLGLLNTEVFIDKILYHYWWSGGNSAWIEPEKRIFANDRMGRPWAPTLVESPNFSWLTPMPEGRAVAELLIIVPARTRTWNIERLVGAWGDTGAWGVADLRVDIDEDDPARDRYLAIDMPPGGTVNAWPHWQPCMHKLDAAARQEMFSYWALGFMGDDHVPRTDGWAKRWLEVLHELGTGIVYGDDKLQGETLPTQWAMTSDIVRALDKMCPSPVEHLFSDTAIGALGRAADCIRYLPDTVVEHMHYIAGKSPMDKQYETVNSRQQWYKDEMEYRVWERRQLANDAAKVRALREVQRG